MEGTNVAVSLRRDEALFLNVVDDSGWFQDDIGDVDCGAGCGCSAMGPAWRLITAERDGYFVSSNNVSTSVLSCSRS